MNKVLLTGRLARDPEVRYTQTQPTSAIARFTLAVDREFHRDGEDTADFVGCVAFGKAAEFAEKYYKKGTSCEVIGRVRTGSYVDKTGKRVYTTDIVVESTRFVGSKPQGQAQQNNTQEQPSGDGFMHIPDGIGEELPFA